MIFVDSVLIPGLERFLMFCSLLIEMDSDTLAEQIKEHFKYDASEAPAPPLKQPFVIGKNIVSPTENDTQNNGFICFSAPCLLTYDML